MILNNNVLIAGDQTDLVPEVPSNVVFHFNTSKRATMFQEGGGAAGVPLTPVTADGQTVGCIYDISNNAMIARNVISNGLPVLGSDATRNSYLQFDGTNDRLVVQVGTSAFSPMNGSNPVYSLMFWVKFNGGDAAFQRVLSTNDGGGTNTGFDVTRDSGNKLIFRVTTSAGTLYSVTSTTNVNVAAGWIGVVVTVNGAGTNAGTLYLYNSSGTLIETTQFNTASSSGAAHNSSLYLAGRPAGIQWFNGCMSNIYMINTVATSTEIANYIASNEPQNDVEFTPVVHTLYDMNDNNFIFSDAGGTTPVTNNDEVRYIKNNDVSNFGYLGRGLTGGSGTSPVWKTNTANGRATIEYTSGKNLTFERTFFEELGGKATVFFVVKNTDATFGSHIVSGDNLSVTGDYVVVTGSSYASGSLPNPYAVLHPNPSGGTAISTELKNPGVDDYKVFAFSRNGENLAAYNGLYEKNTSTSSNPFSASVMGRDNFASSDWDMTGNIAYVKKYSGILTDAQIRYIIWQLNLMFNL
jgi:hypothetical protein